MLSLSNQIHLVPICLDELCQRNDLTGTPHKQINALTPDWYASCYWSESLWQRHSGKNTENKKRRQIMLWAIVIAGTYVAGIYLIRLVWWQE